MHIQGRGAWPLRASRPTPLERFERKNKQLINWFNKTQKRSYSRNQKITTSTNPKRSCSRKQLPMPQPLLAQSVWGEMSFRNIKSLFIKKCLSKRFYERLGVIFLKVFIKWKLVYFWNSSWNSFFKQLFFDSWNSFFCLLEQLLLFIGTVD